MAFTANTAFEPRITNNQRDNLVNVTGRYQSSSTDADCDAGHLCVRNGNLPCEGFTGVYNENAWYMNDATDATTADDVVFACNTYETQLITAADGNNYRVGSRTLGLGAPAGRNCTFTQIVFDGNHKYRFGVGNLSTTLSTNGFCTIDDGKLVPAASAPTNPGSLYFKVAGTGNFVEGAGDSFGYVDVWAYKVAAVDMSKFVGVSAQTFTTEEKAQARTNIGAAAQA